MVNTYSVTIAGATGTLKYEVVKTKRGVESFAAKVAKEAFYGETVKITITEVK